MRRKITIQNALIRWWRYIYKLSVLCIRLIIRSDIDISISSNLVILFLFLYVSVWFNNISDIELDFKLKIVNIEYLIYWSCRIGQ